MFKTPSEEINKLDLMVIVNRLSNPTKELSSYGGWSKRDVLKIAAQYKVFWYLKLIYPDEIIVPFREVDEFWHNHIIFTEKYFQDCLSVFGKYLHHKPHEQINYEDREFYKKQYKRTLELLSISFPTII